jgi:ATP-dependent RNA helicase RhlE
MLDMGFMPDVQKIVRLLPRHRQSVFLSATMPAPIEKLAASLLHHHVTVMVTPPSRTADRVEQRMMFVDRGNKRKLLDRLLSDPSRKRVLVFMRTKHGADRLYKSLVAAGVSAEGIHGGRSQNARQRVLNAFRNGEIRVLIATDVAARGIDIDDISHVINYDVPVEADSYVHRIGRTARAGASGESITLCDGEEFKYVKEIEKTIGMPIPVDRDHPFHSTHAEDEELRAYSNSAKTKRPRSAKQGRSQGSSAGASTRRKSSEQPGDRNEGGAVTQRRRSISGKVKKIKPRSPSSPPKTFGKRSRPKSKRR